MLARRNLRSLTRAFVCFRDAHRATPPPFFCTHEPPPTLLLLAFLHLDGDGDGDDVHYQAKHSRLGRQRSQTRHMLADAEIDHYDDDEEPAYLLDPITYEPLDDPVCTR
jgi:hypothetical protein